jgi:hypothetical protein
MNKRTLSNLYLIDFVLGFLLWIFSLSAGNKWFELMDGLLVMIFSFIGYIGINKYNFFKKNLKSTKSSK